ncbi:hypothetical protein V5O48_011476 [Marasmius crinis-equi]|uniref:Uncharacterized protein n=1 Tax=Marasmius crinis-equi TaxID=585013 RepID=A0ABR3F5K0_9AGAR
MVSNLVHLHVHLLPSKKIAQAMRTRPPSTRPAFRMTVVLAIPDLGNQGKEALVLVHLTVIARPKRAITPTGMVTRERSSTLVRLETSNGDLQKAQTLRQEGRDNNENLLLIHALIRKALGGKALGGETNPTQIRHIIKLDMTILDSRLLAALVTRSDGPNKTGMTRRHWAVRLW